MMDWLLYNNWKRVEQGLKERLEKANMPSHVLFLLSALMDAREQRIWGNHGNDRRTGNETV